MSEFLDTPELQDKVIVRLVDDDKDFLRSMKLMLEMMGWKVRDFSLAQDFLQEDFPDLQRLWRNPRIFL